MCRRPSCQGPASATLSFSYQTAEVLLFDLVEERHPSRWDLCGTHADTLGVPRGWSLLDEREAAAGTLAEDADPPTPPLSESRTAAGGTGRRNRYAELSARLADLAGEHAPSAHAPSPHPSNADASAADGSSSTTATGNGDPTGRPVDRPTPEQHPGGNDRMLDDVSAQQEMPLVADEPIPGQLSMTLPGAPDEPDAVWGYAGNVVPLLRRESVLNSLS